MSVKHIDFLKAASQGLEIEIYSMSDLRRRLGDERLRPTFRYDFHLLLVVTEGECTHLIDSTRVHCVPGSLLIVQPTEAHTFNFEQEWDGWMVVFSREFLLSTGGPLPILDLRMAIGFEGVPGHIALSEQEFSAVQVTLNQMRSDAMIGAPLDRVNALLRHQLYALIMRLGIQYELHSIDQQSTSSDLVRFKAFQRLADEHFAAWHKVANYAAALNCSERSLTRATMEALGIKAKTFIASRISLEAKRLLTHTDSTVTLIAEQLGFADTANFIKFYKRETGTTPGEFRHQRN